MNQKLTGNRPSATSVRSNQEYAGRARPNREGSDMAALWRIHLRSSAEAGIDPTAFCVERNVVGVGWAVGTGVLVMSWDEYASLAQTEHAGDRSWDLALRPFRSRLAIGDLCWARDKKGVYYLGRITGEWEYRSQDAYRKADIVNVRPCAWVRVGTVDAVPGKVVSSFVPAKVLQPIKDATANSFSEWVYAQATGMAFRSPEATADIFSLLSSEDCEDAVALYLQARGYHVIPSSCKADTLAYEYVLKHHESGRKAVAQVKRGHVDLHVDQLVGVADEIFLFTTHGQYLGRPRADVHCIEPSEISDFLASQPPTLPDRIRSWLRWWSALPKSPPASPA